MQGAPPPPDAADSHADVRLPGRPDGAGVRPGATGGHDEHRHPSGLHHGGGLRPHTQVTKRIGAKNNFTKSEFASLLVRLSHFVTNGNTGTHHAHTQLYI